MNDRLFQFSKKELEQIAVELIMFKLLSEVILSQDAWHPFSVYLALISTKMKANNTFAFISMGKQNMQMDFLYRSLSSAANVYTFE